MDLGDYAEVVDAIRMQIATNTTAMEGTATTAANVASGVSKDQSYHRLHAAAEPPRHMTESASKKESSRNGPFNTLERNRSKPPAPGFPHPALPRQSLAAREIDASGRSEHDSHSSKTPSSSTEHLYDSVGTSTSSHDPLYHTLESSQNASIDECDSSAVLHFYHVLEGPTKIVPPGNAKKDLVAPFIPLPPVPPKPKAGFTNRQRMSSCVATTSTGQRENKAARFPRSMSTTSKRSVADQLTSVMAIYEEVPRAKKDSTSSILLPPKIIDPEKQQNENEPKQKEEDHIYHVLMGPPQDEHVASAQNKIREQQKQEPKLKENSGTVSQTNEEQNVHKLSVSKTNGVSSKPECPKLTKQSATEMAGENNYAEPTPISKAGHGEGYGCPLFDDPAYCTQSYAVNKPLEKVESGPITEQPKFDDPSYAVPLLGVKVEREDKEPLFDDPQYDQTRLGVTILQPAKDMVEFDDPKYQAPSLKTPSAIRPVFQRTTSEEDSSKVRLCSSMQFLDNTVYSNTYDFLEAANSRLKGGSVNNITDCEHAVRDTADRKMRSLISVPKSKSSSALQYVKITAV